jgi:Glycosyltransferase family 87
MHTFFKRRAAFLVLGALGFILVARGIVPAMSKMDTDFPNYFAAAKIVADGGDTARLYDDSWFKEQMRHYRMERASQGQFAPFPPPTALLLVPLTRFSPLNALRMMTVISAAGLFCSILLLTRILSWRFVDAAVFVLLSGYAVLSAFRFGQPYILVSLSCILGYFAHLKGRSFVAGLCFGVFAPIKYFPVVVLVYFVFRKEWRLVFGGAVAILVVVSVSVGVLGWKIHEEFLSTILGNHLIARLDNQDPFTVSYQSFDSLFHRLFLFDATLNPRPMIDAPRVEEIGLVATKGCIFLAAVASLVKLARSRSSDTVALSVGVLGILTLLLAPATATYHFVLLWLPVGLLVDCFFRARAFLYGYFVLGAYALIGFCPYGHAYRYEGRGGLTALAYPRLFLLLAMLLASVHFIWNRAGPVLAARARQSRAIEAH